MRAAFLLSVALLSCQSFGQWTPKAQRQVDVFECRCNALTPYVGEVFEVEQLVRDALSGKADPASVIIGLGGTIDDVRAASEAWGLCALPQAMPQTVEG